MAEFKQGAFSANDSQSSISDWSRAERIEACEMKIILWDSINKQNS